MSRLISFGLADSVCNPREENENYKMKILAYSETRTHYLFRLLDWRSNWLHYRVVLTVDI